MFFFFHFQSVLLILVLTFLKKEDECRVSGVTEGQSNVQNRQYYLWKMSRYVLLSSTSMDLLIPPVFVSLLLTAALMFYASCES